MKREIIIKVLVLLISLMGHTSGAQDLPVDRFVDWSAAGLQKEISYDSIVNVLDYGFLGDGLSTNDIAFKEMMADLDSLSVELVFPSGSYLFNEILVLPSNTSLRGSSPSETRLLFDMNTQSQAIIISGSRDTLVRNVGANFQKGSQQLLLENTDQLKIGDWLYLSENDESKVSSSWAIGSTGQMVEITSIVADTLFLNQSLRRNYSFENSPVVQRINTLENVSIENLSIERLDETAVQTSNIFINYAVNCKVSCIESYQSNFGHITTNYSAHIEIEGSYFDGAFNHGGGGKAYGVTLQFGTSSSKVSQNIFRDLRHSILLQAGPNGNVISYNYSREPFWEDVFLPSNSAGDLVLHGNYPYSNLFEGNTAQQIVIDDSHGQNGPDNCFFRNRLELYGIFMNNNPASNDQIFIGNEVTNPGLFLGNYELNGTGHFEYANNVNGEILPENVDSLTEASLYIDGMIEFYDGEGNWPPIGFPNELNEHWIKSQTRFDNGQKNECETYSIISEIITSKESKLPSIYPNPVSSVLFLSNFENISQIEVYNLSGQSLLKSAGVEQLNCSMITSGIHHIRIVIETGDMYNYLIYKE